MSFFEFPHTRTYDSDLGWLIKDYTNLDEAIKALNDWKEQTQPTIDDFKALYEAIVSGNLPDGMTIGMMKWMEENALDILGKVIKMAIFSLTDDGYLLVFIPDSWDDITFGTTGLDTFPTGIDYGHLTLTY
jgi:hypothetical protein